MSKKMENRKQALAWWRGMTLDEQRKVVEEDTSNKMPFNAVSASSSRIEILFNKQKDN